MNIGIDIRYTPPTIDTILTKKKADAKEEKEEEEEDDEEEEEEEEGNKKETTKTTTTTTTKTTTKRHGSSFGRHNRTRKSRPSHEPFEDVVSNALRRSRVVDKRASESGRRTASAS